MAIQHQPTGPQNGENTQQATQSSAVAANKSGGDNTPKSKQGPRWWDKFLAWPEGVATSALIVTLCAIIWQAVETRRSVGAVMNSERSWLLAEGVDNPDLQQVWINKATIRFKIVGNSPLRIMEGELIYTTVASRPDGKPPTMHKKPNLPQEPIYAEPVNLADSPSMGRIHAPGDPVAVEIPLKSTFLTPENVKALEDGNCFLCVYGFLRYQDSFVSWKRRETRFCFACGNWGPTNPKATNGYFVAGPAAYNEVMEVKFPTWRRLWGKAMRSYRKA
jgi:hypothetical protein